VLKINFINRIIYSSLRPVPIRINLKYGFYRQSAGRDKTRKEERGRDIHASNRIRAHDSRVYAGEHISNILVRPYCHCDLLSAA
jgi:hypothetical protein